MYKVIACSIFKPYIEYLNITEREYSITYLEIQKHNQPNVLASEIQREIDDSCNFEKIIILYGLCGGSLLSIRSRGIPLVVIKVHDCMSILLGSKRKYEELTQNNKSLRWSCYSLKQDGFENDNMTIWELMYDEETVEYLKSVLIAQTSLYISLQLPQENPYLKIEENVIVGNFDFLRDIISLKSEELLYVYENQKIKQTIDSEIIEVRSL